MLTINDVKANDFAYFNSIEPANTRAAVKNAFRYLISIANLSNTIIDNWDLDATFKEDGRWIIEKPKINSILFAKRSSPEASLPEEVREALAAPLKSLFLRSVRTQKEKVRRCESTMMTAHAAFENAMRNFVSEKDLLRLREVAGKADSSGGFDQISKILADFPVKIWNVEDSKISFVVLNDTVIHNRNLSSKLNRSHNLGRIQLTIDLSNFTVRVLPVATINAWCTKTGAHPHSSSVSLCWGGFSADYLNATAKMDLYDIVSVFIRWKNTYASNDALTSISLFNHHPHFTTYNEGDWLFGKTEEELFEECAKSNLYFCPPLVGLGQYAETTKGVDYVMDEWSGFIDGDSGQWVMPDGYDPKTGLPTKSPLERRSEINSLIADIEGDEATTNNFDLDRADITEANDGYSFINGEYVERGPRTRAQFYYCADDGGFLTRDEFIDHTGDDPDDAYEDARNQ